MSKQKRDDPGAAWDSVDEAQWESFPASDPPAIGTVFQLEPPPEVGSSQRNSATTTLDEAEQ